MMRRHPKICRYEQQFWALLLPPLVPFIRMILLIAGLASSLYASIARFIGYWRPIETDYQERPYTDGPGEDDLYHDIGQE